MKQNVLVPIVLALLSLLVSGWVGYSHQHEDTTVRISVVEAQQRDDRNRLERIEDKLDQVLRRLDK